MNAFFMTCARWLTVSAVATMFAACTGMPAIPTEKTYDFEVEPVLCNGDVVGITVTPKGGNRRIRIDSHFEQVLVWKSAEEFSIKFERLDSDTGRGGGSDLGGPTNWTKATKVGNDYVFRLPLGTAGSGTETAKYAIKRKGGDTFELDPVIIVDR